MTGVFVGRGVSYPMRVSPTGALSLSGGDEEISEKMRIILGTSPGERPMRPDFGCPIFEHVFSPADPATLGRIAFEVRGALARWEPRVEIMDVDVRADAGQQTLLYIDVTYAVRDTNDMRNLVFPFYVIPDEDQP